MQIHHFFTPRKASAPSAESPVIKRAASLESTPTSKRPRTTDTTTPPSVRKQAKRAATRLFQAKIVSDVVYNTIQIDPLCEDIIDTPQFQRLHHLKQLGTCDYVFRGMHFPLLFNPLQRAHISVLRRHTHSFRAFSGRGSFSGETGVQYSTPAAVPSHHRQ